MENPLHKLEASVEKRMRQVSQHTTGGINQEIETIIDKTIESPEIEAIVIQAVERVIFTLAQRYWRLFAALAIGLLLFQSIILSFMLRGFLPVIDY